ncbi:MAG: transposase [Holophagaceae bacterium]|nr:transposase [Holophagaceae bacterium]
MASITLQRVGKYTYLYESVSYWDRLKKRPDNHKTRIGKIDLVTGEPVYAQEYLDRLASSGKSVEGLGVWGKGNPAGGTVGRAAAPIRVASCGVAFLLTHLAGAVGLRAALEKCFPDRYAQMLAAAFYILCEGNVMMYMEDWFDEADVPFAEPMDGQQCSRLFASIEYDERMRFFKEWVRLRSEQEYIAYDVTSVSTASSGIDIAEWGYNRDGEGLPQVNLGMFYGSESHLPVYYNLYGGSITDKSHLPFMMEGASKLGIRKVRFVLDRGFVTEGNLKHMGQKGHKFVTAFPHCLLEAKRLIDGHKSSIRKAANRIDEFGVYGRPVEIELYGSRLNAHIYFDTEKQAMDEKELYAHIGRLESELKRMGKAKRATKRHTDYFMVEEEKAGRLAFRQDDNKIDDRLGRAGFFILLTNDGGLSSGEVLGIYRRRDAIEKNFDQLKNGLDFRRLRTHANKTTDGKVFVGFLSLALRSHMMKKLKECKTLKRLTLEKIMLELKKIKSVTYDDSSRAIMPLTKLQREILEAMGSSETELRASIVATGLLA